MNRKAGYILTLPNVGAFIIITLLVSIDFSRVSSKFTLSSEPVAILAILIFAVFKIATGFVSPIIFCRKFKFELLCLGLYFFCTALSLFINRCSFESLAQFVRYGLTFWAITFCLPLLIFSFLAPLRNSRNIYSESTGQVMLALFLFLLCGLAVLQFVAYPEVFFITKYFKGAALREFSNVSSIFNINTDLGAILALFLVTFVTLFFLRISDNTPQTKIFYGKYVLSILLICITGIISGARNFLFCGVVGVIATLGVQFIRGNSIKTLFFMIGRWKGVCVLFLLLAAGTHLLVLSSAHLSYKYGSLLPYIRHLYLGNYLYLVDFFPNIDSASLSGRLELWKNAITVFHEYPLLGISNGVFRLQAERGVTMNAHNFLLQWLIEGGLLALLSLLSLVFIVFKKSFFCANKANRDVVRKIFLPFVFVSFSCLVFDYFPDHSLAWSVSLSFCLGVLIQEYRNISLLNQDGLITSNSDKFRTLKVNRRTASNALGVLAILALLTSYYLIDSYLGRVRLNQSLSREERVLIQLQQFVNSEASSVLIDKNFSFNSRQMKFLAKFKPLMFSIRLPSKESNYNCLNESFVSNLNGVNVFSVNKSITVSDGALVREFKQSDGTQFYWYYYADKNVVLVEELCFSQLSNTGED